MMNAKLNLPSHTLKDIRVLLVEDEEVLAWSIDNELRAVGVDLQRAASVREAIERFAHFSPDLVVSDLRLPDGNGLELLKKWRHEVPDLPVILMTANGAIDSAITALRLGAFDYLQKPFDLKDLIAAVKRAAEIAKLRQKVAHLQGREAGAAEVDMIGETSAIRVLREELRRLAASKASTVLILGESGSGKELAARAVHEWSERRGQPFVEINCASIPETLLESELFGYEKGAFTDARERKLGLFEIARGGSIFLDEIGEMPLKLQAKLLRVLEYRRFKRLGGTRDIEFSGRIIAATNRDLLIEAAAQRFRADLYYRISALPVEVPALRHRMEDLPLLVSFLLTRLASELGLSQPAVSATAMSMLMQHPWPGNVRELRNVLQRAMVFYEPAVLEPQHLRLRVMPSLDGVAHAATAPSAAYVSVREGYEAPPPVFMTSVPPLTSTSMIALSLDGDRLSAADSPVLCAGASCAGGGAGAEAVTLPFVLPEQGVHLDELERSLLVQALDRTRNNQTRAAQLLGISRHTLRYRLEKHGLLEATASSPSAASVPVGT